MTQYWGGSTRHFFLLNFYNFKNIWGGAGGDLVLFDCDIEVIKAICQI